jgi:hypothetical protein
MRVKYIQAGLKGLFCVGAILLAAGCNPPRQPANPAPQPAPPISPSPPAAAVDASSMRDAVTAAIKDHSALFPKGTKLQSVVVDNRVATLDFSAEFNALANMGDSTESAAQKQLRAALAKFPDIDKMSVSVNGKPFDSQTTDWTTPFPVRLTEEEKSASRGGE